MSKATTCRNKPLSAECNCFEIREPEALECLQTGNANIFVYRNAEDMGLASAISIAAHQRELVQENGEASFILMAAPSAFTFYQSYVRIAHLSKSLQEAIRRTHFFQFDDYPLPFHHPASFRQLLCKYLFFGLEKYCDPAKIHLFNAESPDIEETAREYGNLILKHGPDLQVKGTGENGHWGFHEPDIPIDGEPEFMRVELSEENIAQQMRDHPLIFPSPEYVPTEAYTANVPMFMRTRHRIEDNIPQPSKAFALLAAYGSDAVDMAVPSSALKSHPCAVIRATEAAAWALLEYRKRGKINTETLHILAQSICRDGENRWKEQAFHVKNVLDKMNIACD